MFKAPSPAQPRFSEITNNMANILFQEPKANVQLSRGQVLTCSKIRAFLLWFPHVQAPKHFKSLATLKTSQQLVFFYLTKSKLMERHTTSPKNRTFFQEVNNSSLHVLGTLQQEKHKCSYCFDSQAGKQMLLFQLNIPGTQNASLKKQYHKTLSCH